MIPSVSWNVFLTTGFLFLNESIRVLEIYKPWWICKTSKVIKKINTSNWFRCFKTIRNRRKSRKSKKINENQENPWKSRKSQKIPESQKIKKNRFTAGFLVPYPRQYDNMCVKVMYRSKYYYNYIVYIQFVCFYKKNLKTSLFIFIV